MKKIGKFICEHKVAVLVCSIVLLLFSFVGIRATDINYDILVYLPEDIETVKGQGILTDEFDMGGFSVAVLDHMSAKDILKLEEQLRSVEGVNQVVSAYDAVGTTIPLEMLPLEVVGKFKNGSSDLLLITFRDSTSSETTLHAVEEIREITKDACKIGGMSAMVLDTMDLSEKEIAIYVMIAVVLCIVVLEFSLDSYLVPFLLLANIGVAIVFNLGSNVFLGQISYITKALVAVLQLGVTTDFSIFLYHSYEKKKSQYPTKEEAMQEAMRETFSSVFGSSLTTIAGFLVLCTMNLTLGKDLGIVMAKGVFLGVVCVLTLFPSLLLLFDRYIEKTKHRTVLPRFEGIHRFVIRHHVAIFVTFLILLIPFYLANSKVEVYYKIDESLPKTLDSIVANKSLAEKFQIVSPEIILIDKNLKNDQVSVMTQEIESIEGVDFVLSFSKLKELGISEEVLSDDLVHIFQSEHYQMLLLNSTYDIATDELNAQIGEINQIIKKYDEAGILAGEGPLMKDLVTISDTDFNNVNSSSIICILVIMFVVLRSFSLPFLLIVSIESAIFANMSFAYFGGVTLPFVAPIVLGTIQLGATIDYAILMSTTYLEKRRSGLDKKEAMLATSNYCSNSILVSGMCFFAATFGVGLYSELEMVGSLCTLISRGAIISMLVVIMVLPSILLVFDSLIMKTTYGMKKEKKNMKNKWTKVTATLILLGLFCASTPVLALSKEETVYTKLNQDGSIKTILVNEHLLNDTNLEKIEDASDLKDIFNLNNDAKFTLNKNQLTWNANGKDIFYQGKTEQSLPVEVKLQYRLNGEEKKLEEIIGKSGTVSITMKYINHELHNFLIHGKREILYTPFLITTGMILPGEANSNVKVDNGKSISNGKGNIVVGLAVPGLYESLDISELEGMDQITVTFDTTKFELPSMYSLITPKLIEEEDFQIFDRLDSLYATTSTLQNSMNQLQEGAASLLDGTTKLQDGSGQLYESLTVVTQKLEEIRQGTVQLDAGLKQILSELENAKASLMNKGTESLTSLKQLIVTNTETIQKLQEGNRQLLEGYTAYHLDSISYEDLLAVDQMNLYNIKFSYENNYEANTQMIYLLSKNNEALQSTLEILSNTSGEITKMIEEVQGYLKQIEAGANKLVDGTQQLKQGVGLLTSKSQEFTEGMNTLYKGEKTLHEGLTKFNQEGISKLSGAVLGKVQGLTEKLEKLVQLGQQYETFTMKNENTNGSTKFVYVIDGVKAPKEEKKVSVVKEKETLWTRIKNLFR